MKAYFEIKDVPAESFVEAVEDAMAMQGVFGSMGHPVSLGSVVTSYRHCLKVTGIRSQGKAVEVEYDTLDTVYGNALKTMSQRFYYLEPVYMVSDTGRVKVISIDVMTGENYKGSFVEAGFDKAAKTEHNVETKEEKDKRELDEKMIDYHKERQAKKQAEELAKKDKAKDKKKKDAEREKKIRR